MLRTEYLFQDKGTVCPESLSDYDTLDLLSGGEHIYGEILWPDGTYRAPRPCVIMLHGFPGSARNDDIAHALCRIGCVVIVPHHRGAWGSEGKYLISHCIEDAVNLAEYARSEGFCRKYHVSPDHIFLSGHSMGGCISLNTGKMLPWLKGLILITPFDPTRYLTPQKLPLLRELLEQGRVLQSDGSEEIYKDIEKNRDDLAFPAAFDAVKDRNILILAGVYDSCAPIAEMVTPLWSLLSAYPTKAIRRLCTYPAEHGLLGRRITAITDIAAFLADICNPPEDGTPDGTAQCRAPHGWGGQ